MEKLSGQEINLYTSFFKQVDSEHGDGNGKLSLANCEKVIDMCGKTLPRSTVESFVASRDDGSWEIGLEEFLTGLSKHMDQRNQDMTAAELRRLFMTYDKNKDGHLSFWELKTALHGVVPEEEIREFIQDWDQNGDWTIDFEEFISMYTSSSPTTDSIEKKT